LPNKKLPELKLMVNGEYRNTSNTISSDEEINHQVSKFSIIIVPSHQEDSTIQRSTTFLTANVKHECLQHKWLKCSHWNAWIPNVEQLLRGGEQQSKNKEKS
jgi:hypothetical protein